MNIAKTRELNQQLTSPEFRSAEEVVRWMGMMQAQDYTFLPWAVGVRMKRASLKRYCEDFNGGKIIRTHLFRNTVQLVCAEDLPWMQALYRDKALAAEHSWVKRFVDIDCERSIRLSEVIIRMLEGGNFLTKAEMDARLREEHGVELDPRAMIHLLHVCEYRGEICSGPVRGRLATYAVQGERLALNSSSLERDEALAELARRYFQSHGPATLDDFHWWSAMTKRECAEAIEDLRGELDSFLWQGNTYFLHRSSRTKGGSRLNRQLLPPFDEYLIGYKSRHHVLPEEHAHRAHNRSGIFWPVLLESSRIVGNWNKALELSFFESGCVGDFAPAVSRYKSFWDQ